MYHPKKLLAGTSLSALALCLIPVGVFAQSPERPASPTDPVGRPIDRGQSPSRITPAQSRTLADRSRPEGDVYHAPERGFTHMDASRKASEIVGRTLRNRSGEDLGKVDDLVIDASNGQVVFALVRSGSVLGLGGTVRAVPYSALNPTPDQDALLIDVDQARWESAPTFRDDQIASLARDNQGQQVYQHFGETWDAATTTSTANIAPQVGRSPEAATLYRISQLDDRDIRIGDRVVGEVEEVMIQPDRRTVALLVETEDDFMESETEFLIGFDQLTLQRRDDDIWIETRLSEADFRNIATSGAVAATSVAERTLSDAIDSGELSERVGRDSTAAEVNRSTTIVTTPRPSNDQDVRFSSATANPQNRPTAPNADATERSVTTAGSGDSVRFADATSNPQNRPNSTNTTTASADTNRSASAQNRMPPVTEPVMKNTTTPRASTSATLEDIRQAVHSDSGIGAAAENIEITQRQDAIVVSGTVDNALVRERVLARVRTIAVGREIVDQLRVERAAE